MSQFNTDSNASFLPQDYIRGKNEHRANIIILLLLGVVMIATVGAFVINLQRQRMIVGRVKQVQVDFEAESAKIEQLKVLESQRAALLTRAEVVGALIDRVPRSVLLSEVVRGMPDNVVLEKIELKSDRAQHAPPKPLSDKQGATASKTGDNSAVGTGAPPAAVMPPEFISTVTLTGIAVLNNDIADLVAALKRSPLLTGVELRFITPTVVNQLDYRKFEITMVIDARADASAVAQADETTLLSEKEAKALTGAPANTD